MLGTSVATIVITAATLPITMPGLFVLAFLLAPHPGNCALAVCGPDTRECTTGNPVVSFVIALLVPGANTAIAFVGQAVLRLPSKKWGRLLMGGTSVLTTVLGCGIFWAVATRSFY